MEKTLVGTGKQEKFNLFFSDSFAGNKVSGIGTYIHI